MAKHKAATQVTIVQEEKSAFAEFVDKYWKFGALAAVVVTVAILGRQKIARDDAKANEALWDQMRTVLDTAQITKESSLIASVATELAGTQVEPWALLALAGLEASNQEYGSASATLQKVDGLALEPISKERYRFGEGDERATVVARLNALIAAQEAWEAANPGAVSNRAPTDADPRVRIETSAGSIVVALFEEEAPKHVENFLKHVDDDYYDGIKFHRVVEGFMIQAGDPNSRDDDDVSTWGQGGPDYTVDREPNKLYHYRGVLAAAKKPNEANSSGSQFYITAEDRPDLDGQYVVYGTVVEGMDVVEVIEAGALVPETDRPEEPHTIIKMERVE